MIETDAPYLKPRGIKSLGRINLPQYVCYVAQALAGYMGIPEEELVRRAAENTRKFFGV